MARENRPSSENRPAFGWRHPGFPAPDEQAPEAGQDEAGRGSSGFGFGAGRRPRTAPRTAPVAPEKARAILATLAATKLAAEAGLGPESGPEATAEPEAGAGTKKAKTKAAPESEKTKGKSKPAFESQKAKRESGSGSGKAKTEPASGSRSGKAKTESGFASGSESGKTKGKSKPASRPGKTKPDGSPRRRFRPVVVAVTAGAAVAVLAGVVIGVVKASDRHPAATAAVAVRTPRAVVASTAPSADASVTQDLTASPAPDMRASPPAAAATVPEPPALGAWPLTVNALASSGTANGVAAKVAFSAGTAVFTGAGDSDIATPAVVLPTGPGDSFTVSAWVDLTSMPTSADKAATAVSQGAGIDSAFYLQYYEPANRWAFARPDADTAAAKVARTTSLATAQTNVWTHLVGVYTASSGSVSLYVNGVDQGTTKDTTPFVSTEGLEIGGARYGNAGSDGFTGAIRDVRVFNLALNPQQLAGLN